MYLLRLTFKSFYKINHLPQKLLKLKNLTKFHKIKISGLFQIKNKNKLFTVLKSPHVNKKSREQFRYKQYLPKVDLTFASIMQLLNFVIILKKKFSENLLLDIKILKKN